MNDLVLGADGNNPLRSTPVYPNKKTGNSSQQWRDDQATGTIRNKLNDYCMDIESGTLVLKPYKPCKESQQWERKGNQITNRVHNIVVDIELPDKGERGKVHTWSFWGGKNQLWTFEMI